MRARERVTAALRTRRGATLAWLLPWGVAVLLGSPLDREIVPPEGWADGTDGPNLVLARRSESDTWTIEPPQASAEHLVGLDRTPRAYTVETNRLLEGVQPAFSKCEHGWQTCLSRAPVTVVRNPRLRPLLCGQLGLLQGAPQPGNESEAERTPTSALRLEVVCDARI